MPTPNTHDHLAALYALSDDPWHTHSSFYEKQKFARTLASLPRPRYLRGLEVGCGAGGLTAHLAARCDILVAIDCTMAAVLVAKKYSPHPNIVFLDGTAPTLWPSMPPDLVVLSEVLYFMTDAENAGLATRLSQDCAAGCDVVLVNWLGKTGGAIGGAAAARRLIGMVGRTHEPIAANQTDSYRIDILRHQGPAAC